MKEVLLDIQPLDAGVCPDSDYCIKMGGCMSGCTQGPGNEKSLVEGVAATPELTRMTIALRELGGVATGEAMGVEVSSEQLQIVG